MENDEIICLSSDDDNRDTERNKVDKKQGLDINQSKDNSVSHIEVEISSTDDKRVAKRGQKRKASNAVIDEDSFCENNTKVFILEKKNNIKSQPVEKEKEKEKENKNGKEENITLLKPKLVVKERKTISSVEQDIFPMFISLCLQKDRSEDMKIIVNKLKRRYEQLDSMYANSEAFIDFLNEKRNEIISSKNKLYTYVAEVMNEMKSSCKGKSTLLLNNKNCTSNAKKSNVNNDSVVPSTLCSNTSHNSNSVTNDNTEEEDVKQGPTQRKINLILKTMKKCEVYIKKLEMSEVEFDDECNSNYIKLEKYKYRMVELYNKYCEYIGENADAGRQYLRPKHFSTTGIVAVDHAITSFINSKISKRNKFKKIGAFAKALIFPDYNDILKCIIKCNELHNLGLDNKKQQQIAKKAFIELGEYLQRCRRNDYWDTFSLFLENQDDDPALKDSVLAEKLMQNKKDGEKKLSNIFQEYVKKQEEMKDPITDSKSTGNEEEEEEDSIENEDADDSNEDDDISLDICLSIDKDKTSSDEDENSTGEDEISRNTGTKFHIEKTNPEGQKDELKENDDNNLKPANVSDVTNISNCESNFEPLSIKENNAVSSPDETQLLSTSSNTLMTVINDKTPSDKIKEEQSNIMDEDPTGDKPSEEKEKEKPLLRVRSFAKPPTTWEDVCEKVDECKKDENTSKTLIDKDVIDLTLESPKEISSVHHCATIQIGSKVLPLVKGKYKTLVIPTGKSIINVKNITNNYVRLNTNDTDSSNPTKLQSGKIISSQQIVGKNGRSTTIHLSSNLSINQQKNANNRAKDLQTKQKSITVQIPPNKSILLSTKPKGSTSQHSETNLNTSQSK
ncbi:PREDICTED: FK506-binding protein 5-like [Habropoda laboriosa]|uniref:FK506-binding protein 5-like n=1 Tax=Habropoda laboriosa TaxID=597456 RepID=UPI00083D27CD|nr:PREDICTED: FK506-binding protein 5-like [Habropoda laboriosa]